MKILILIFLAVAVMPVHCGAQKEGPRSILEASDFSLEQWEGQVVFLDFWASWCGPCKKSMPWLSKMQEEYGSLGLQIVAVNLDKNLEAASGMLGSLHSGIQVVHDAEGELAGKYELEGMPSAFLYDRGGRLIASHVGFLPAESENKEQQIRRLLAKENPDEEQ